MALGGVQVLQAWQNLPSQDPSHIPTEPDPTQRVAMTSRDHSISIGLDTLLAAMNPRIPDHPILRFRDHLFIVGAPRKARHRVGGFTAGGWAQGELQHGDAHYMKTEVRG